MAVCEGGTQPTVGTQDGAAHSTIPGVTRGGHFSPLWPQMDAEVMVIATSCQDPGDGLGQSPLPSFCRDLWKSCVTKSRPESVELQVAEKQQEREALK